MIKYVSEQILNKGKIEMANGEMENGEMVNSPAFGEDLSNGDMRPSRAPGMPKIKRVNIHVLAQFIVRQCLKHISHPNDLE